MAQRSLTLTAALILCFACSLQAEDWTNWRGPNYNGSSNETNLPVQFSKTENVKWSAIMPGPSAATPIICGDRVFVSSTKPDEKKLLAMCLDRATGKTLWMHEVASGFQRDNHSNYASPSPVTDGKVVVFFYGTGDMACFDMSGKQLWSRNIQKDYGDFCFQWTFSSSPTLLWGKLYLEVLERNEPVHDQGKQGQESFILAMDPATGKTIWRHVRPSDAHMESREAYGTPMPYEVNGKRELVVVGGDVLTGHDPETGKELWRWGTYNPGHREQWWRLVTSTVIGDGIALVCAPKRAPVYAVNLADAKTAWVSDARGPITSDVPTPLYYEGRFFVLSDVRQSLSRVEPKTGKVEWTIKLPGFYKWRASPTGADGRIYVMNHHADVLMINPADGKIIAQAAMGADNEDNIRSSISVADGDLFIRTNSTLYCVGK